MRPWQGRYWAKNDPLQDRILIGKPMMPQLDAEQPRQIIGIVADQRDGSLNQDPEPEMYIPNGQATDAIQALNVKLTPLAWVIRTRVEPMKLRAAVEEQLRQVSGLPVSEVRSMDAVVSRSTSRQRFHMLLMSMFGGVSLVLAAIGIYGLMTYSVEQRTQEIGIRMALGAEQGNVRGMVMRQGITFASYRHGLGHRRGICSGKANFEFPVRCDGLGSCCFWSDSGGVARDRGGRHLVAGASSDPRGSGNCFAAELSGRAPGRDSNCDPALRADVKSYFF